MSKLLNLIAGLVAAEIGFVILYPILGVTLWVSFLVAACLLVAFAITDPSDRALEPATEH